MLIDLIEYLNTFDYMIILIMLFSICLGMVRGMIKETCYILGWLIAFFLAYYKLDVFTVYISPYVTYPELANLVTVLLIFMLTVSLFQIIGWFLSTMLRTIGLGIVDRIFGVGLGVLRGFLITLLVISVCNMLFPTAIWLQNSIIIMYFSDVLTVAENVMPGNILELLQSSEWYTYVQAETFEPVVSTVEGFASSIQDSI
ncbi:MAG: hypothetical protein CMF46_04135 [Legionellales bacterium]|nr:hypothetical protein [Legionellales bacterium]|tara:strand:- start:2374 stop:2973 length:600 start_codon:yes stop_codon:yes gene_type:complete